MKIITTMPELEALLKSHGYPSEISLPRLSWINLLSLYRSSVATDANGNFIWVHSTKVRPPPISGKVVDLSAESETET